ncbi:Probable ATP-dependent helicase dinG homolog [Slackia heliotrinireducens]|nr:helicase C-terminal domain-containing protein [Slackia heliotrinireducens]VEH03531.1 Probable ATP-dependent helicase dinG homolog [Slackia heliotrinireducens]
MTLNDYITDGTPEDILGRYAALKEYTELADFGMLDRNLVVLDTETTGLSYNHDELTQIAAARMECGEITDWFVTFVNPGKPIPDEIVRLTNIHDEDVVDAPTPDEARALLAEFIGDAYVVAHNADFDKHFCTKSESGECLNRNIWVDSLALARIALPRMKSHRLIDLVHAFDAPISTHRADADVEALCAVYRILLSAVATMPPDLVEYIANLAPREEWPTGVVFENISNLQQAMLEAEAERTNQKRVHYPFTVRGMRSSRFRGKNRSSEKPAPEPIDIVAAGMNPALARNTTPLADDGPRHLEFPSVTEIDQAFSVDGLIGSMYENYEPRIEQKIMAEEVLSAFSTSNNLVVEAGTGVGKSMAYLVPAAVTALRNNIPIGIATKTNALLDQLVYKELPMLAKALEAEGAGELKHVALKGFSHYPCLRRISHVVSDGAHMVEIAGQQYSQATSIAAILSYIEQTEYDDIDALKLDYRTLPRYAITTSSRECLRKRCPFFGTYCFVHGARRQAEHAHVVVTNHALFFRDLAADGNLLPHAKFWIVDEAHGAEAEARKALAINLDAQEMLRLAGRLTTEDAKRNAFVRLERRKPVDSGTQPEASTLFYSLTEKAKKRGRDFGEKAEILAKRMKDLVKVAPKENNKNYDTFEVWINDDIRLTPEFKGLQGYGRDFVDAAEKLISSGNEIIAFLDDMDGVAENQREIASIVIDAKNMLQACETILGPADLRYVYSARVCRKPERVAESLEAQIVDIGQELDETLYERTQSVVYASATISISDDFQAFNQALGLNASEASRSKECLLGSSYDYNHHMRVFVLNDMPEPNNARYMARLQDMLLRAHLAQQGSMLTLFTNRREMEQCFDAVNPELKANDLRLVCQKWGVSVKGLRDDFLADKHLSLFALKSFWEGFDAPGATLRGVIIPKLPFAKPSDPLSCERSARDRSAWAHYVLPKAVIEVKQAAGRLIRTATDEGVLILADRRLLTKGYGKSFLNSLPSTNITMCSIDELIEHLLDESTQAE